MKAKLTQFWQCGGCGTVYNARPCAETCCLCSTCGAEHALPFSRCAACNAKHRQDQLDAAERVSPDAYEQFCPADGSGEDFVTWDGVIDAAGENGAIGEWHPGIEEPVRIDATDVIESLCSDFCEEATEPFYRRSDELQKVLDDWVKSTGSTTMYFPDDAKVIDENVIAHEIGWWPGVES